MGQNYGDKEDIAGASKHLFGLVATIAFLALVVGGYFLYTSYLASQKPAVHAPAPGNAS